MFPDSRVYVIAEIGVNHNGSTDLAKKLVDAAAAAGADCAKFQTFKPEMLTTREAPKAQYQSVNTRSAGSQLEMLKALELGESEHQELKHHCERKGIEFMSSAFDLPSLRMLVDRVRPIRLKFGSGEITNGPLLLAAAMTNLPIVLSTGMSTLIEIDEALKVLASGYAGGEPGDGRTKDARNDLLHSRVVLLHCTSEYPAPPQEVNLLALQTLAAHTGLRVGFSDHTEGTAAAPAAVALGACVVEKHLTLDRAMEGPDHKASLTPADFAEMVRKIREVESMLGDGQKVVQASEAKNRDLVRKSLVASRAVRKGEVWSSDNLTAKRPGTGVSPMRFWRIIGQKADRDYAADELLIR